MRQLAGGLNEHGDRDQRGVVQEVRDDGPHEPPPLLERARDQVAERDGEQPIRRTRPETAGTLVVTCAPRQVLREILARPVPPRTVPAG